MFKSIADCSCYKCQSNLVWVILSLSRVQDRLPRETDLSNFNDRGMFSFDKLVVRDGIEVFRGIENNINRGFQ